MEKAEKYLKEVNSLTAREELYKIGTQMQIDAYNQALEDAAENAELESYEFKEDWMDEPFNMIQDDYGNIRAISKQSILKLKK